MPDIYVNPIESIFFRPHRRAMSRNLAENTQMRWNALIDEYILLGIDPRSKKDIERAAKIGTWNGALIMTCEGKRCGNYEDRDVECFKFCSKCKMVSDMVWSERVSHSTSFSQSTAVHPASDQTGPSTRPYADR